MTLKKFMEQLMNSYAGDRPGSLDDVDVYVCPYEERENSRSTSVGLREEPKVLECSQVGVYKGRHALFIGVPGKFKELTGLIGEAESRAQEPAPIMGEAESSARGPTPNPNADYVKVLAGKGPFEDGKTQRQREADEFSSFIREERRVLKEYQESKTLEERVAALERLHQVRLTAV